jgi:hypothetical protein
VNAKDTLSELPVEVDAIVPPSLTGGDKNTTDHVPVNSAAGPTVNVSSIVPEPAE